MSHNVPKVWYFKCYNDVQVASVNTGTEIKKISEQWNADLDVLNYVLDVLAIERYKSKIRSRARSIRRKCECHTTEKVPSHRQVSPRSIQSFNKTNSGLNRKTVKPVLSGHPREMAR